MQIESVGMYRARGYPSAEVFAIRGNYCLGYVVHPFELKKAAVWRVKDGTRVNGPAEEDLLELIGLAKPRVKKSQKAAEDQTPRLETQEATLDYRLPNWAVPSDLDGIASLIFGRKELCLKAVPPPSWL
jgi:hypothetical protein